ncbi:MAG: N-acetylmuramoyl-L-alanine amidase [Acidobacteria bacterium]|nr:N-acetylmuramoyl-L-alanine amidase [Acidobacteriota bacterium]
MRRGVWIVLFVLAAAGAMPLLLGQAPALTLVSRDGRQTLPLVVVNNQDYVAVDDLAGPFGTTAREAAGGLTVTARNRTIIVTADQPVVSVAGRLVSLAAPALRRDNRWLVPLDFLPRALGTVLETRIDVRRASRTVVIGDLRVPRVVTRVESGSANASIVFEMSPATTPRVTAEAGRLIVQFDADALDLLVPTLPQQAFVTAIAAAGPTAITITTGPRFSTFRSATSQPDAGSTRLTIDLLPAGTDAAPAPTAPPAPAPDIRPSITPIPAGGLRTVVIDPGHGGDELGAQGPNGAREKDITLAVSRRLRTLIESRLGLRVFLTRDDDRTVSHDDRSAFANNHQADVFLSIHANAAVRAGIKGAEVYYLSVERADAEARRRAEDAAVTLPALGGGTRTIDLILWETAQARYLEQSSSLAGAVEQALRARVEMSPRPVQQAPFRVLVGANMPAVLVEIGYVSNPEQEQQLTSAAYQDRIAEALLDAIIRFRASVDRPTP